MSCEACENNPVVPENYTTKGSYETIADCKTYVYSTSSNPTRALICIYDIFGFHAHTLQGADRLAASIPDSILFVPDFFKGETMPPGVIPPTTEEQKNAMMQFISTVAAPPRNLETLSAVVKAVQAKYPSVKSIGSYGLCWGGKIAVLASGEGTVFKVSGTAHPGRVEAADAEKLTIPHICLFSKEDGEPQVIEQYTELLNGKKTGNYVEKYGDMHHGWMGARANLDDPKNLKEFERGYAKFAEFYKQHL